MSSDAVTIVFYVLGADKYYAELLDCLKNVREHEPDRKIVVYCDRDWTDGDPYNVEIRRRDWKPGWLSKIRTLADMPEDRILYLDTDTYLTGPLEPMFRVCAPYAFAAAPDPIVDTRYFQDCAMPWPDSALSMELNCGVMYVSKAKLPAGFFERWIEIHHEIAAHAKRELEFVPDQLSLRRILFETQIPFGILPNLYNFRACYPQTLGEPPVIIHSRTPRPQMVAKRLRKAKDVTVWFPFGVKLRRVSALHKGLFYVFRKTEALLPRKRA